MSESASDQMVRSSLPRRRVLVVNCYLDYSREPIRRPRFGVGLWIRVPFVRGHLVQINRESK